MKEKPIKKADADKFEKLGPEEKHQPEETIRNKNNEQCQRVMPVSLIKVAVERGSRDGIQTPLKPWQHEQRHQQQMKAENEHLISETPAFESCNAPLKPAAHTRDCRADHPE